MAGVDLVSVNKSSVIEIFKPSYEMRTLHQVIFARLSIEEVSLEP